MSLNDLRQTWDGPVREFSDGTWFFHWKRRLQTSSAWIVTDSAAPCRLPDLVRPSDTTAGPLADLMATCLACKANNSPVRRRPWKATSKDKAINDHPLNRQYPTRTCRVSRANGGARLGTSFVTHVFIRRQLILRWPLSCGWVSCKAAKMLEPWVRPLPLLQRNSK